METDRIAEALNTLVRITTCECDPAYTRINRHEPNAKCYEHTDALTARQDYAALRAKHVAILEALTPSAETKAAYSGEFHFLECRMDDYGGDFVQKMTVPWTTIKEIMAAILERANAAALAAPAEQTQSEHTK